MIINGSIFTCKDKKVRIILNDDDEIFYEPWNNYSNSWHYAKVKTVIFYRMSKDYFLNNYNLAEEKEFTEEEKTKFRPDLPLKLNRFENIFWSNKPFNNFDDFKNYLKLNNIDENKLLGLNTDSVFIEPTGPNGPTSSKLTSELIQGDSNAIVNGLDLMFRAFNLQSKYMKENSTGFKVYRLGKNERICVILNGIGIYRSGYKKKIPTYFLGAYKSFSEAHAEEDFA